MSFLIKQSIAASLLDDIITEAGSSAKLIIYDGNLPENADAALSFNFEIASFTCANPCGTRSGRTLTISLTSPTATAIKDGVATFFRLETGSGSSILQGKVSSPTGNGQMKLQSIDIITDDTIELENIQFSIG